MNCFQEQFCDPNVEVCCKLAEGTGNSNLILPNIIGKTIPSSINDLLSDTGKSSVTGSSFKFTGSAGFSAGNVQVCDQHICMLRRFYLSLHRRIRDIKKYHCSVSHAPIFKIISSLENGWLK